MALSSTSRPGIRGKVLSRVPATLQATGGLAISKENGVWTLEPDWSGLALETTLSEPENRQLWVLDPATGVYTRMSMQAVIGELPDGPQGIAGPAAGFRQAFDAGTTDVDPGAGEFSFNHATLASVTEGYLDNVDAEGSTVSAIIDTFDDSTNVTTKGRIRFEKTTDGAVFAEYTVTGTVVDGTGYRKVTLTHIASAGTFTAADEFSIAFFPAGDKGTDGAGTGDVVGPAASVDGEIALFDLTTGKLLKRASTSGVLKAASGVIAPAVAGTDYLAPGAIGVTVQGYDADTLKADTADTLTAGFNGTVQDLGTITTGTVTPDAATGNAKKYVNGGAHTLAPPSTTDFTSVHIQITNNSSAGAVTTSGFTKVTGSSFTTTDGHDFFCFITKSGTFSHLHVQALQ